MRAHQIWGTAPPSRSSRRQKALPCFRFSAGNQRIQGVTTKRITALVFLFLWVCCVAQGAGVTIITHGFQPFDLYPDWVDEMGTAIAKRAGSSTAIVKIDIDYGTTTRVLQSGVLPTGSSANAEVIIKVFWNKVAASGYDSASSTEIATQIIPYLTNTLGWIGTTTQPFAQMPIHLIGHSRGGSVVSELARLLGQRGIWVNQVTTLDPHPVRPFDFPSGNDAEVRVWDTVLFADNYYELNGYINVIPSGEPVNGAKNNFLALSPTSYPNLKGGPHSDIHLWYHGTVDTGSGASDGTQTFTGDMRNNWYLPNGYAGQKAGFYYSRLGGGAWALDGFFLATMTAIIIFSQTHA